MPNLPKRSSVDNVDAETRWRLKLLGVAHHLSMPDMLKKLVHDAWKREGNAISIKDGEIRRKVRHWTFRFWGRK